MSTTARPNVKLVDGHCAYCKRDLVVGAKWDSTQREWIVDHKCVTCSLICHAQLLWTAEEWEGQKRMASARVAAGVELTNLDRIALTK